MAAEERVSGEIVPESESVCLLELVCPECGRVTTDKNAPGCAACRQPTS